MSETVMNEFISFHNKVQILFLQWKYYNNQVKGMSSISVRQLLLDRNSILYPDFESDFEISDFVNFTQIVW